jgi:anti-sigma-K factor RskA
VTASPDFRYHHADDLLEDYLLGTLSAEDSAWVQEHIQTCAQCQAEVESLMGAIQALPFATPDPQVAMSDDLWNRIERSVAPSATVSAGRDTFVPLPDVSHAQGTGLRSLVSPRTSGLQGRQWMMVAALMALSLLTGGVLGWALTFTDPSITATGELRYLPEEKVFVLEMTGMPEPPDGYVYQAWLIDEDTPVPVGVMDTDSGEFASSGDRDAYQTFAITVEAGPLGNAAPTSDPILVASLHGDTEDS